jgi:hypothetical protein
MVIYPATVRDYGSFRACEECFRLEKNSVPDPKIISMTDLEYLYHLFQTNNEIPYLVWFDRVLSICLKDDKSFEDTGKSLERYRVDGKGKPFFIINGKSYTSQDYAEIKNIICTQNLVDLPDENISKEVRHSLELAKEYKRKLSNEKPASLEDYIVSLAAVTGWTFDYIYDMSLRKFDKCLRRMDMYIHYKIFLSASMSGMVEFKDKSFIKHWLTGLDDEKYKDVTVDLSTVQDKVSFESAKK